MGTIEIGNRYLRLTGIDPDTIKRIDRATSYRVAGFMFDPRWRRKPRRWDGREHLLEYVPGDSSYRVPIGLLEDVTAVLRPNATYITAQSSRPKPPILNLPWTGPELRPYQRAAVDAFKDPGGWDEGCGRGIISLPIRSGKTLTAAAVASELGTTAIFIVPSQLLLGQTVETLSGALDVEIGVIGSGTWDPKPVTVATIQTLTAKRGKRITSAAPEYLDLVRQFGLVVFDEVHHLTGTRWHRVMGDFEARYRLGLSATAFLDDAHEVERGVIWLKASTGPIRHSETMSRMIREGYLLAPDVRLHKVTKPDLSHREWNRGLKDDGIYLNQERNSLVAELAKEHARAGRKVLVVSKSLAQVKILCEALWDLGVGCEVMIGTTPAPERRHLIKRFVSGELPVIVGTVFGEGVDIPECEVVINADGGKDRKATVQRMRCLTPSPGKQGAFVEDFIDMTNNYLAEHALERLKVYREEPEFRVEVVSH